MNVPLLRTKLNSPPSPPAGQRVARPRLIQQLSEGVHRQLTVLSAPAGFGKTTLLAEWIHSQGAVTAPRPVTSPLHIAWLSLDKGDNDPARFMTYLAAALQSIDPQLGGDGIDELLASITQPTAGKRSQWSERILTTLLNQISLVKQPSPLVLILDDFHLVSEPAIHAALAFLLDHQPNNLHLVIASRADPPLPLARLRGRGQLTELRQRDLCFTYQEAADFLNQVMELGLTADDVAALTSRAEGWIAGLQMAALSMRGHHDPAGFVRAFTGSDRYILDYLMEEVLHRQSESTQSFLLQTSILDQLNGSLCDAVCNRESSQSNLEALERANLFILPLDNERRWYRYHRLFADLLQQRLQQLYPQLLAELHGRASHWFEQNDQPRHAIEHALQAQDFERAASLVETQAEAALKRSEVVTLINWLDALPDPLVEHNPTLCLFHAWALILSGRPLESTETRLQQLSGQGDLASGGAAALRAYIAIFRGEIPEATDFAHQALQFLPDGDSFLRSIAIWNLGISYLMSGDVQAGSQVLDEAIQTSKKAGDLFTAEIALCNLAELHLSSGQLQQAEQIYQRALALGTDEDGHQLPIVGMALIGLGEVHREWNHLEQAEGYLTEGFELIQNWGEIGAMDGLICLYKIQHARGELDAAQQTLDQAQQLAVKFDATELDDLVVALQQAFLWIARGEVDRAARWLKENQAPAGSITQLKNLNPHFNYHMGKYEGILHSRILLAQQQPAEALAILEPLQRKMEQRGVSRRLVEVVNLRAVALYQLGDTDQALEVLKTSLTIAEPNNIIQLYIQEGQLMAELLQEAATRHLHPTFIHRLLPNFAGRSTSPSPSSPLLDTLSERELQVLQLLNTPLSSTEIAQQLVIAPSTVRSHIKNIYSKLNVHRRREAVDRAQELGLL